MAPVCEPPEYSNRDGLGAPYDQAPINRQWALLVQRLDRIEPDDDAGRRVGRLAELQVPLGVVALEDFVEFVRVPKAFEHYDRSAFVGCFACVQEDAARLLSP